MDDPTTNDLIDRNHVLIAAATQARSDIRATLLKAERGREQARITGTVLNLPIGVRNDRDLGETLIDILVTDCRPQCRSLIAMQSQIRTPTAWQYCC